MRSQTVVLTGFLCIACLCFVPQSIAQEPDVKLSTAIANYFVKHDYLLWPSLSGDLNVGDLVTEMEGRLCVVKTGCFTNLRIVKGYPAGEADNSYRVFHRGRLPQLSVDLGGITMRDNPKIKSGRQEPGNPPLPQRRPPGPGSPVEQLAGAIIQSLHVEFPGREPVDVYVRINVLDGELYTTTDGDLLQEIQVAHFEASCGEMIRTRDNFLIAGLIKGRLQLKCVRVTADQDPQLMVIEPPAGWTVGNDGSITMDQTRTLAFFPLRVEARSGKITRFRDLPKGQWKRILARQ